MRLSWRRLRPVSPRGFSTRRSAASHDLLLRTDTDCPAVEKKAAVCGEARGVRWSASMAAGPPHYFFVVTSAAGKECKLSWQQGLWRQQRELWACAVGPGRQRKLLQLLLCRFWFTLGPSDLFEWINGWTDGLSSFTVSKTEASETKRTHHVHCQQQ